EGIISYTFLIAGGYSPKKAFLYSFIIAGLTTPFGAFIVYPIISSLNEEIISFLVSFAGGMLVYFSASHLIPETRQSQEKHSVLSFLSGVLLAFIFFFYFHKH
ncbi:MAG: zinc/iron permease, partial [Patescibacteria group bacterium]|nr:zinc/iron permease [Patescibacteria group bacterium]